MFFDRRYKSRAARPRAMEEPCAAQAQTVVVVDYGRPYNSERSWIDNALTENQRAPFHAIIAQQNLGGNAAVLPAADLDEHQPLIAVAQDRAVSREAESIAGL